MGPSKNVLLMKQEFERLFPEGHSINGTERYKTYDMVNGITCSACYIHNDPEKRYGITWWKNPKDSQFPWHPHPETECIVVIRGKIEFLFEDGKKQVIDEKDRVICIPPNRTHMATFPEETEYLTIMLPVSPEYPADK